VWELAAHLAIGALSGLLAGLFGIGGGVIIVPALVLLFTETGIAPHWIAHLAVGTSLAAIVGTGAASALAHHRRRAVRWDLVARLAPGMVLGAGGGALLASGLPQVWMTRAFALFLGLVGLRMLFPRRRVEGRVLPGPLGIALAGSGIGALSALVGIGGGTLTVPFLNDRGIGIREAVGTSAACGLPIALAGTLGFILVGWGRADLPSAATGFVYWPAVAAILLTSIPTAPLGARLAHRLPVESLRRAFGILLLIVALRLTVGG
jgi:uncharacterized membrane protein YfcA